MRKKLDWIVRPHFTEMIKEYKKTFANNEKCMSCKYAFNWHNGYNKESTHPEIHADCRFNPPPYPVTYPAYSCSHFIKGTYDN